MSWFSYAVYLTIVVMVLPVCGLFINVGAGMLTGYYPSKKAFAISALIDIALIVLGAFVNLSLGTLLGFAIFYTCVFLLLYGYARFHVYLDNMTL